MKNYAEIADALIEEREKGLKKSIPSVILAKVYFIIIDKNNQIRTSVSKTILNEESLHRIICIEKSHPNTRYLNSIELIYLDNNGNTQYGFSIDGWELCVQPTFMCAKSSTYIDFEFYFQKQENFIASLNHMWETFLRLKEFKTKEELKLFKDLYINSNNKSQLINELNEKCFEYEIMKKKICLYEDLLEKLK